VQSPEFKLHYPTKKRKILQSISFKIFVTALEWILELVDILFSTICWPFADLFFRIGLRWGLSLYVGKKLPDDWLVWSGDQTQNKYVI
jgi:hypothetical protein